jgi:hypothetical protein
MLKEGDLPFMTTTGYDQRAIPDEFNSIKRLGGRF